MRPIEGAGDVKKKMVRRATLRPSRWVNVGVALWIVAAVGCASSHRDLKAKLWLKDYEGVPNAHLTVETIRDDPGAHTYHMDVKVALGEWQISPLHIGKGTLHRGSLRISPGKHLLRVKIKGSGTRHSPIVERPFEAKAGDHWNLTVGYTRDGYRVDLARSGKRPLPLGSYSTCKSCRKYIPMDPKTGKTSRCPHCRAFWVSVSCPDSERGFAGLVKKLTPQRCGGCEKVLGLVDCPSCKIVIGYSGMSRLSGHTFCGTCGMTVWLSQCTACKGYCGLKEPSDLTTRTACTSCASSRSVTPLIKNVKDPSGVTLERHLRVVSKALSGRCTKAERALFGADGKRFTPENERSALDALRKVERQVDHLLKYYGKVFTKSPQVLLPVKTLKLRVQSAKGRVGFITSSTSAMWLSNVATDGPLLSFYAERGGKNASSDAERKYFSDLGRLIERHHLAAGILAGAERWLKFGKDSAERTWERTLKRAPQNDAVRSRLKTLIEDFKKVGKNADLRVFHGHCMGILE